MINELNFRVQFRAKRKVTPMGGLSTSKDISPPFSIYHNVSFTHTKEAGSFGKGHFRDRQGTSPGESLLMLRLSFTFCKF